MTVFDHFYVKTVLKRSKWFAERWTIRKVMMRSCLCFKKRNRSWPFFMNGHAMVIIKYKINYKSFWCKFLNRKTFPARLILWKMIKLFFFKSRLLDGYKYFSSWFRDLNSEDNFSLFWNCLWNWSEFRNILHFEFTINFEIYN